MAAASSPSSADKKPAVLILACRPVAEEMIAPILWGLEEEGIPVELGETENGPVESLAKQAADASPLNVGIGFDGAEQLVALHHRDLQAAGPLFALGSDKLKPKILRQLGLNAARLVKGNPLVLQDEVEAVTEAQNTGESGWSRFTGPSANEADTLQSLIVRIVTELLQKE